jgi:hypothetical protein
MCRSLLAVLCLLVVPPVCTSTTLVALWTPEKVILAADSRVTHEAGVVADACKIEHSGSTWIAVSGLVSDPSTGFSLGPLARPALMQGKSMKEQIARFADAVQPGLTRAVDGLRRDAPDEYGKLASGRPVLQAILASQENGKPVLATVGFVLDGSGTLQPRASLIDGSDARGPRLIYAGQQQRIREYLKANRNWIEGDRQALVRDLVQLEIDAKTEHVGGPVDVIEIDTSGTHWIQRKSACAD